MPKINSVDEAVNLATEYAREIAPVSYPSAEVVEGFRPALHVNNEVTAEILEPDEVSAITSVIGNIIDTWQDLSPSVAKNWRQSVVALMMSAMILKGITSTTFGNKYAEEKPAALMATEIRPPDLDKTDWSISYTSGDQIDLLGSPTSPFTLPETPGSRKVICIIKNGIITIDEPIPFKDMIVTYSDTPYKPYSFGMEGKVTVGQANNKLIYNARVAPTIIQPAKGIYIGCLADTTVTLDTAFIGMTFYEQTAYNSL